MVTALWTLGGSVLGTLVLYAVLDRVLKKHGDPRIAQRLRKLELEHRETDKRLEQVEGVLRLWPRS
jgi:hypothetical protein